METKNRLVLTTASVTFSGSLQDKIFEVFFCKQCYLTVPLDEIC